MLKENEQLFKKYNIDKWQKNNLGEDITVVFLDMGNEVFDYIPATFPIPSQKNYKDSHVAAVVAVYYQIAPKANIIVFTPANSREYDATFDWIKEHKDEIDLISISMSMSKSVAESMHIPEMYNLGIPIVSSAGNQEDDKDKMKYPALYDFSITVGSYNDEYSRAEGTVEGAGMTCLAPYSTHYPNSRGIPTTQYGTSFASPFVSGSLSLYLSWRKRNKLKKISKEELKQFVIDNCEDIYSEGFDIKSGHGLFRLPSEIPIVNNKPTPEIPKEDNNMELKDIKGHWAENDIKLVVEKGLMNGYPDSTFKPNQPLTRAEYATLKAREIREQGK